MSRSAEHDDVPAPRPRPHARRPGQLLEPFLPGQPPWEEVASILLRDLWRGNIELLSDSGQQSPPGRSGSSACFSPATAKRSGSAARAPETRCQSYSASSEPFAPSSAAACRPRQRIPTRSKRDSLPEPPSANCRGMPQCTQRDSQLSSDLLTNQPTKQAGKRPAACPPEPNGATPAGIG